MTILLLDKETMGKGLDFSPLASLGTVLDLGTVKTEEQFLALLEDPAARNAEILLCSKAPVTKRILAAMPQLSYVGVFATGYNNADLPALSERGIALCNVPDYSSDAVAQLVCTFLLMTAGKTHLYAKDVSEGAWIKSPSFSVISHDACELSGKTLGILGYGNIGKRVAALGRAFGMTVLVHTRTVKEDPQVLFVSREELLQRADFLSLNAPLNDATAEFINSDSLRLMKRSAVLINTARGGLVNEEALATALKEGQIAFACLDVLKKEPMEENCPLYGLDNCLITPHIAWTPLETRRRLLKIAIENLAAFLEGREQNRVI
jgi:glycerate dehydrogenase